MAVYLLAALPLCLALLTFSLGRPWTVQHLLAIQQYTRHVQYQAAAGVASKCSDSEQTTMGMDPIGFLPDYAGWNFSRSYPSLIVVATTTSADLHTLLPWIYYHRMLGVDTFYIFAEGKLESPENHAILRSIPGVKVNSPSFKLREKQLRSQLWQGNWLLDYQYKPCNYQLHVRQALNLEAATNVAKHAGMEWILHLGVDEMIHPGGETQNSLVPILQGVDKSVDLVVFPHYESVVENDNVQDTFTEVTLFKRSLSHIARRDFQKVHNQLAHNNSRYFLSHGDGRIAARLQPGLHPNGPHRWSSELKLLRDVALDETVVLHYTYTKFSDLTAIRTVCDDCQPTPVLARRCFTNEFDSTAFIAAKTLPDEELFKWYKDHVVWEDKALVYKLIHQSILVRNHIPQVTIQGLREVSFFQDIIEAGRQAYDLTEMTKKLELKEMRRLGQEAGKLKLQIANLDYIKRKQKSSGWNYKTLLETKPEIKTKVTSKRKSRERPDGSTRPRRMEPQHLRRTCRRF